MSVDTLGRIAATDTVAWRRWLIPLAGIVGWTALTAMLSFSFFSARDRSHAELVTANNFLLTLDDMLSAAQDAETGQRGYLITQNPAYLQPYHKGIAAGLMALNQLAQMRTGQPAQLEKVQTIRSLWNQNAAELATTIDMVGQNRADDARRVVSEDRGKSYMDQLRAVVADLRSSETQARERAIAAEKSEAWRLLFFTQATTLISLMALLYLLFQSKRSEMALLAEVASRQSAQELALERQHQAARSKVMTRELVHRTKNLISVVQAIVRNQQKGSPEIDRYVSALSDRLVSLGSTLDILIRENWHRVTLKDLVEGQLAHFSEDLLRRIVVKPGPVVRFSP